MRKATKKKAAKSTRRRASPKKSVVDLREVRQKVKSVICGKAQEIAKKVADDVSSKAQVQSMKTLFEVIGLFPETAEEKRAAGDDQALAKVLLERLGLPDDPVVNEEEAQEQRELEASARAVMSVPVDPVE